MDTLASIFALAVQIHPKKSGSGVELPTA